MGYWDQYVPKESQVWNYTYTPPKDEEEEDRKPEEKTADYSFNPDRSQPGDWIDYAGSLDPNSRGGWEYDQGYYPTPTPTGDTSRGGWEYEPAPYTYQSTPYEQPGLIQTDWRDAANAKIAAQNASLNNGLGMPYGMGLYPYDASLWKPKVNSLYDLAGNLGYSPSMNSEWDPLMPRRKAATKTTKTPTTGGYGNGYGRGYGGGGGGGRYLSTSQVSEWYQGMMNWRI